jgi:hypothetical protein
MKCAVSNSGVCHGFSFVLFVPPNIQGCSRPSGSNGGSRPVVCWRTCAHVDIRLERGWTIKVE